MKQIFLIVISVFFINCSHNITRIGYTIDPTTNEDCVINIVRDEQFNEKEKIGELKIGDTGFSTKCNEKDAISLIKKEGCKSGANIANIIDEKRIDVWSSCYRATIEFYKTNIDTLQLDSNYYSENNIVERKSEDNKKSIGIMVGALVGGFLFGFLLFL